jgi:hypothetical protein
MQVGCTPRLHWLETTRAASSSCSCSHCCLQHAMASAAVHPPGRTCTACWWESGTKRHIANKHATQACMRLLARMRPAQPWKNQHLGVTSSSSGSRHVLAISNTSRLSDSSFCGLQWSLATIYGAKFGDQNSKPSCVGGSWVAPRGCRLS